MSTSPAISRSPSPSNSHLIFGLQGCSLDQTRYFKNLEALSSSWLGHGPLKAGARVRVPLGLVNILNSGIDSEVQLSGYLLLLG